MSSMRFEEWRAYLQVKAELEEEAARRAKFDAEAKAKGGTAWHYDVD